VHFLIFFLPFWSVWLFL